MQERVVTRDSIIVLLRDTVIYVEIERVTNSDAKHIKDTIYLENKYSYAYSYVLDSMLFMQLVQKQQSIPFRIQYSDKEHYSERDSVTTVVHTVEVNRQTKAQIFFQYCGYALCIIIFLFAFGFIIKKL